MQPRLAAAKALGRIRDGGSLDRELPPLLAEVPPEQQATAQALVYGALRQFELLEAVMGELLRKPLKRKDRIIDNLLFIALFELLDQVSPDYAVVDSAVRLARRQRSWSGALVNGCLRRFLREKEALLERARRQPSAAALLPGWLLDAIRRDWPDDWQAIAAASARPAPMTLRVDLSRGSRDDCLARLRQQGLPADAHACVKSAIVLTTPAPVSALPGFAEGLTSVQDAAAQMAATLLAPRPGERVLDACAAPGGKTTHLWEAGERRLRLTALEISERRIAALRETLDRCACDCRLIQADAARPDAWWDGKHYDRILLDAPCSATGVIRRHPDIKRHRRPEDIERTAATQAALLKALWPLLKPGGRLLYATCSVLAAENEARIESFLAETPDASAPPLALDAGVARSVGWQIRPGDLDMDGFYFALLQKQ
ncbi:MAG TPA: 16S rRNA (cytosine(967)-C(5))-methyltransferase RsmB [Gammaproteobacteria bacterium]|nr:16S rRNA (cytosine(967)-C(5))-methyltransferase RsmB [Gammaproteobacteria bacterium]